MTKPWFYMAKGRRIGPVTEDALLNLRQEGVIDDDTLVWSPEDQADHPDWRPYSTTGIKPPPSPPSAGPAAPPPAPLSAISNLYAWLIILVPLALAAIDLAGLAVTGDTPSTAITFIIGSVLYIGLSSLDTRTIDKSGHVSRAQRLSAWWIVLIPVYLWRRGSLLKKGHAHVWLWLVVAVISAFITQGDVADFVMAQAGRLPDCGRDEVQQRVQDYLEDLVGGHGLAAVDVQISEPRLKSAMGSLSETCVYRATLPNGANSEVEVLVTRTTDGFRYIAGNIHDLAK
jgi:GYF domain 2